MPSRFENPSSFRYKIIQYFGSLRLGMSSSRESRNNQFARISPHTSGRLRRSTLITLRWMAVMGQTLALMIVTLSLKFSLPIWSAFGVIAVSVVLNIILTATLPLDRRVSDTEAVLQLGYDILHLSALLWLTGGMVNPFSLLFLAPVVTAATTLNRKVFSTLSILTITASLLLLFYHLPLPWNPVGEFDVPDIYAFGGWTALMVGIGFSSLYTWRASLESQRMSEALASTQAVLAHEQKLAALGSLAAAAAHELGTPLATIQITAKEMEREIAAGSPLAEDAALLRSQAERCRDILHRLSIRGDEEDPMHNVLSFEDLINEAVSPFIDATDPINIDMVFKGEGPDPRLKRQPELIFGLKNFIENALDFAAHEVLIETDWNAERVKIMICDDGPGFDPRIRDRLGEPYVSARPSDGKAGGLGLGVFIAKTLIERTGGQVTFGHHKGMGGAVVVLQWPRAHLTQTQIGETQIDIMLPNEKST
ncbi:MAG: ActS/PrrB/RegB family redox-sensitive histidine kinase [Maricaulaceae bacterium]